MNIKNETLASVHSFDAENYSRGRREEWFAVGEMGTLAAQLVDGWDASYGVPVVYELSPEERKAAQAERVNRLAQLRQLEDKHKVRGVEISAQQHANAYEDTYFQNGKAISPKYGRATTFRRGEAMLLANAYNALGDRPMIEGIPVEVRTFDRKIDQMVANSQENELKTEGYKAPSRLAKFENAYRIVQTGGTEQDLRRAFNAHTGQLYSWLFKLVAKFPKLDIIDTIRSLGEKVPAYHYKVCKDFVEKDAEPERVMSYIGQGKKGLDNTDLLKRAAPYEAIQNVAAHNPVSIVAFVAAAIADNRPDRLSVLNPYAEAINAAIAEIVALPESEEADH